MQIATQAPSVLSGPLTSSLSAASDLLATAVDVLRLGLERSADEVVAQRARVILDEAEWLASDLLGLVEVAEVVETSRQDVA